MIRTKTYLLLMSLYLFFGFCSIKPSILITGDPAATEGKTFSFPIKQHMSTPGGESFFVAASPQVQAGQAKDYALSYINHGKAKFMPLAPETITLNEKPNEKNPLYDTGIALFDVVTTKDGMKGTLERPVVVPVNKPASVYLIDKLLGEKATNMFSIEHVYDAYAQPASKILALAGTDNGEWGASGVFAAVANKEGNFDGDGSGIALLNLYEEIIDKDKKITKFHFEQVALGNGLAKKRYKKIHDPKKKWKVRQVLEPYALPVGTDMDAIKIGNAVASLGKTIDMWWDTSLQRLYVAVQTRAGGADGDGAKAVFMIGFTKEQKCIVQSVAPNSVFMSNNAIVGAQGAHESVSIHKVRTLKTSTGLDHLVVLGGNGTPESTKRSVYALPLTNNMHAAGYAGNEHAHGVLAHKYGTVVDVVSNGVLKAVNHRVVVAPAQTLDAIFTTDRTAENAPAHVGAGPLEAGDIADIIIVGDTVFARVPMAAEGYTSGIFYSQALLAPNGKIKAWTTWQKAALTTESVYGFDCSMGTGLFLTMTGSDAEHLDTVRRTGWGAGTDKGSQYLATLLEKEFPMEQGGLQGLSEFPLGCPALPTSSMLVASGLHKVALIETGYTEHGVHRAVTGQAFEKIASCFNGTYAPGTEAHTLIFVGGALESIGSITAATIAQNGNNGNQGLLFVGGSRGLAVLTNHNGAGWDALRGVGPQWHGLSDGMTFKRIGDYTNIKKIMYDDAYVYVLTNKKLDRIDVTQPDFPATTIATIAHMPDHTAYAGFLDCIVSDKLALLATTVGLYRTADGNNVQTITEPGANDWQSVTVAESYGPIVHLHACTVTGREHDVARGAGGNVYVLSAHAGKHRAHVSRFAIHDVDRGNIDMRTVMPIINYRFEGKQVPLVYFGGARTHFVTDGALSLQAAEMDLKKEPIVRVGSRRGVALSLDLKHATHIIHITRNSALGSWLIAGDAGIRVNE